MVLAACPPYPATPCTKHIGTSKTPGAEPLPLALALALAIWGRAEVRGRKLRNGSAIFCPVCSLVPGRLFRVIGSSKQPERLAIWSVQEQDPSGPSRREGVTQDLHGQRTHTASLQDLDLC